MIVARPGETFRIGRLRIRVLWPDGPGIPGDNPNNHAVLLVSYGQTDALFTADAESDVPVASTFLRSRSSRSRITAPRMRAADESNELRPRIAVVSVGRATLRPPDAVDARDLGARPWPSGLSDRPERSSRGRVGRPAHHRANKRTMLGRDVRRAAVSVYLLTGSDRPKHLRALRRLRGRFDPEDVEQLSAESTAGADAVASCNALGLFGGHDGGRLVIVEGVERWRKADLEAIETYLRKPVEGAVLALYTEGPLRGATLADLVGKHGQVLDYNVPKPNNLHRWVAGEFKRLDIKADADASRALVEIVGDDTMALSNEILKLGEWAAESRSGAQTSSGRRARARVAAWALSDAWGARDLPTLLEACELSFETTTSRFSSPSGSPRMSVACARRRR